MGLFGEHQAITNRLPGAERQLTTTNAFLVAYQPGVVEPPTLWSFQYRPQSLRVARNVKYSAPETLGSSVLDQQYAYTEGKVLELPDIVLEGYYKGRHITPLLDGLNYLMEIQRHVRYHPPVLQFVFGARRFYPCVVTAISWEETAWLNGLPASARLNMTLQQVPLPPEENRTIQSPKALKLAASPQLRNPLTAAQTRDVSALADKYLQTHLKNYKPAIQTLIRSKQYSRVTDAKTGQVKLIGPKGKSLGIIGTFNEIKRTFGGGSTVPLQRPLPKEVPAAPKQVKPALPVLEAAEPILGPIFSEVEGTQYLPLF